MAEALIPIVQRAYDFAVNLHGAVTRFPRAQKPLLGRELVGLALRVLVTRVTSNRRRDTVPDLDEASGTVDARRITLRLSTRLSLLSHKGSEGLSRELDEIRRMLGGWLEQSTAARTDTRDAVAVRTDAVTIRHQRGALAWRCTTCRRCGSWRPETLLRRAPLKGGSRHSIALLAPPSEG